jgi:hypothetical protein
MMLVPFVSLMFEIQPVKFGPEFALAASLYLFSNFVVSSGGFAPQLAAELRHFSFKQATPLHPHLPLMLLSLASGRCTVQQ